MVTLGVWELVAYEPVAIIHTVMKQQFAAQYSFAAPALASKQFCMVH